MSDFFVEVDLLDWDNELNQAFGFLIRAETIALGQTTGYVVNYDPQQELRLLLIFPLKEQP